MNAWDRFRRWCMKKQNAPLRRILGITIVGSVYLISDNLWATFCAFALWLVITR